jgi:thioredoxin reductase (NADPH)
MSPCYPHRREDTSYHADILRVEEASNLFLLERCEPYVALAADLHLEPGEYLIHEGEPTPFFVVMEGTTEVLKDVMGRQTEVSEHNRGDFFGELAILMATAAPVSVRAKTACHLARLDPQHLQELIRRSPEFSAVIVQTLNERVQVVQKYMLNLPSSRVQIST